MRIEFGTQNFNVGNTTPPESAKHLTNKDVLDNPFPQR